MKKITFLITIFTVLSIQAQVATDYSIDSPVTANISNGGIADGVHIAKAKESLHSISRKYNLTVDELCEINNIHKNVPLRINQSLKVVTFYTDGKSSKKPYRKIKEQETVAVKTKIKEEKVKTTDTYKYHVIKFKETLYSISRKYGITVQKLKKLNNITSNTIGLGSKLRVE